MVDPADITHGGFPEGPAGRFNALNSMSYGPMKYSDNRRMAGKALLTYWTSTEPFTAWLEAQEGYIIPPALELRLESRSTPRDPKLAPYLDVVNYGRNKGFAGPANQKAADAGAQYVVVDTFAKAVQTGDAKGAIEDGREPARAHLRPLDRSRAITPGRRSAPAPVAHGSRFEGSDRGDQDRHRHRRVPEGVGRSPRFASLARREAMLAYALMLPGALVLILFMAYPFFLGIWLSLTDKRVGSSRVRLRRPRQLSAGTWHDEIFRQTVKNTFIYGFGTVPFKLMLGLGLALLLNERFRGSRFARAGLLLPWIVPTAISSLAWLMLFDPFLSPISLALKDWGLISDNINFLGDPWHARASLCLANVWRGIPFFAISILAGLQAVPDDLHEAAALDGANAWQRFWSVTLPGDPQHRADHHALLDHLDLRRLPADLRASPRAAPLNSTHVFGTYSYDQCASAISATPPPSRSTCSRS